MRGVYEEEFDIAGVVDNFGELCFFDGGIVLVGVVLLVFRVGF